MTTKITTSLLLAGIMAAFCCSVGNAQIIYSNNFSLGTGVSISNTPPTVANTYAGGISSAVWDDQYGASNPNPGGVLLDNGVNLCPNEDYFNLPFIPQRGHVYLLTVNMVFTNNPGVAPEFGFSANTATNIDSDGRFNGSVGGYDWMAPTYSSGNIQYFAGSKTANTIASINGIFPVNTPSTNTYQILLDTRGVLSASGTNWSCLGFVNGVAAGALFTYANPNPTNIQSVGITLNGASGSPSTIQYNSFTLTTAVQPFIATQPVLATTLGGGSLYTNSVLVMADTNGGTLFYQWYAGGAPLANGGSISGANTNILVINPIATPNQLTNYYVIVTNNYGSATSSLASLMVLTNPVTTAPLSSPISATLFAGTGGYVGSSPSFSVSAVGAPPLVYRWLTNGVVVGGATSNNFVFTNCQSSSPSSYTCVVSNSFGQVTNTWLATYIATPTAAYPQAVLAAMPVDFWRLNEADDNLNDGNPGAICHDYQSGDNGVYTNVSLGNTGYDPYESTETSALFGLQFGGNAGFDCYAGQMQNEDFAVANGANAEFTVEAWAQCFSGNGAPVVAQGVYGMSDSFNLGMDTNINPNFQFYVRSAGGTVYKADSSIPAADSNWHHLVGVCDQARSNLTLYVDGQVVAVTSIPAKSGLFEAAAPIAIGAGDKPTTGYNLQFQGYIADVAAYNHALSIGQVIGQYAAFGNTVPVSFISPPPPTNYPYLANQTLTIPVTVAGSAPFGYYWTNLTDDVVVDSGETSTPGSLAATLTIPNASASLSGDQLELVVTNAASSTNCLVTLFNPAPPVALDYSDAILYSNYFNGGTWSIAGMPVTAANLLVGGTNTTWVDALGTNDTAGSMLASGTPSTTLGDSWLLPFMPHAGYVYTLTASVTFSGNPGNWLGIGFAQNLPTTNATSGRLSDTPVNSYGLIIVTESSGNVQYFVGPGTGGGTITNKNAFFTAGVGTHTVQEVLDTTGTKWKIYAFVDGVPAGTNTFSSNPSIASVGFTQNVLTTLGTFQWNYFALTQVAPGGVPPYVYNSVPPTNVTLLADTSLSIPVTTFGSAPFGYYWSNTNTAALLGSGATGTMTPLSANLAVADVPASWNGNTLALIVTNAYGTNVSLVSVIVTNSTIIPTSHPTITGFSLVGGTNVMINATNGQSGGTYYLLGSTNLTTPLSQWLPLATNVIITNGGPANGFTFSGTNVIHVSNPQQFFMLSNTN